MREVSKAAIRRDRRLCTERFHAWWTEEPTPGSCLPGTGTPGAARSMGRLGEDLTMRARLFLGMLSLLLSATAARAETLIQTDFTAQPADVIGAQWEFNEVARLTEVQGEKPPARLRMSHGELGEKGAAWHKKTFQLSSFTAQFDVQFRRQREGDNPPQPGDGMAFVIADVPQTFVGAGGGSLGLYGGDEPLVEGQVFGLDISIY